MIPLLGIVVVGDSPSSIQQVFDRRRTIYIKMSRQARSCSAIPAPFLSDFSEAILSISDQPCATDEFKCENSKKCISLSKVCDSKNDCGFREDEPKSCNINECKDHNGNCSQICTDKNVGYECSCRDGYKLDKDGRTCEGMS